LEVGLVSIVWIKQMGFMIGAGICSSLCGQHGESPVFKHDGMNLPLKSYIHSALRISLIYACFAGVWIWLSNWALPLVFPDPTHQILFQSVKGSAFSIVTSLLLYLLIKRDVRAREALTSKIELEAERLTHIKSVNPAVIFH
jgi:hypothetical protein